MIDRASVRGRGDLQVDEEVRTFRWRGCPVGTM